MKSRENIVALKVFDLLSDVRLDPTMVGFYLAHIPHPNLYEVFRQVILATENTMEEREHRLKEMVLGDE